MLFRVVRFRCQEPLTLELAGINIAAIPETISSHATCTRGRRRPETLRRCPQECPETRLQARPKVEPKLATVPACPSDACKLLPSHVQTQTAIACKTLPSSEHNQTPAAKQADSPRSVSIGMAPAGQFEELAAESSSIPSPKQAPKVVSWLPWAQAGAMAPSSGCGGWIKHTTSTLRRDCLQQVGWPEVLCQHLGRLFSVEGAVSSIEATRDAVSTSLVFTNRADLQS